MQGSIQKRQGKRGTSYMVRVEYPPDPVTGVRRQRAESFRTRKEAEAARAKWVAEIDRGTAVVPDKITVAELLRHWLDAVAAQRVKPTTLEDYRATVEMHVIPLVGDVPAQRLAPARVQAFYAEKAAAGAERTVQLCHLRLSQALSWAERMGIVPRNVCAVVEPPTHKTAERTVWTPEEAGRFLAAIAGEDPWHALFLTIVTTGLRRGEALGLRWQDVDLARGAVAVRQAVTTLGSRAVIETPKSAAARRTVRLPAEAVAALRERRARQVEHRLRVADLWTDHDLVFCTELGGVIHPSNVNRALLALSARADVPRVTVHDLRHAHATWLLASGQPLKTVSDRMGHAKASITLDTYAHVMPGMQDGAVEAVSALLFRRNA